MKVCEECGMEIDTVDGDNKCVMCDAVDNMELRLTLNAIRNRRKKQSLMVEAMENLGLVKVRGMMGGIYYE